MNLAKLRAWWFHRQCLDRKTHSFSETLSQCGWARSVGGSSPYLGFFVRTGARRDAVDQALARAEIHELPAARGCTYVVPAADYELALRIAASMPDGERKVALRLGVSEQEIAVLADAVRAALASGDALSPDGLKALLGDKVRNLGEQGRSKGITTTLPLALGELQVQGRIRRIPTNGRLDQQRYQYLRWDLAVGPLADGYTTLARRYFDWIGPATMAEFQWFSGLGVKAAREAVEPLGLVLIEGRLLPAELVDAYEAFRIPKDPCYALVGSTDSVILLRRNILSMADGGELQGLVGTVADLPSHAILDRGAIVGLWEYDPAVKSIAWMSFRKADPGLEQAVKTMQDFIGEDLGDVRAMSLDSPASRAGRIAALRAKS